MQENPRKTLAAVVSTGSILLLILVEIILRIAGHEPGKIDYNPWFSPVDELYIQQGYYAGEDGITKIHPEVAEYMHRLLSNGKPIDNTFWIDIHKQRKSPEVYDLIQDFSEVNQGIVESKFGEYLQQIRQKPDSSVTELEKAYLEYSRKPINQDGFRSIEFGSYGEDAKKILLLGDSFGWGHSADNRTSSFADVLATQGLAVYNTGISGADPPQYLAIAEKYIPQLKPDAVVVNFFMGNDIFYFHRKLRPGQAIYYHTNAGNLYSCPQGVYWETAEEAYQFVLSKAVIPNQDISFLNKMASWTVLSTKIWQLLRNLGAIPYREDHHYAEYYQKVKTVKQSYPVTRQYLERIEKICTENGAKYMLALIPEGDKLEQSFDEIYPKDLFKGMDYHMVQNLSQEDYKPDGHYNDHGHKKHARMIQEQLQKMEQ